MFAKANLCKHGYQHTCLECKREISSEWYKRNKEHKNALSKQRRQSLRQFSGNWEVYFKNLLVSSKHKELTVQDLLELLESQKGVCALSGETLTAELLQGRVRTNASIDRIIPGGPYEKENIRLVCLITNSMRLDMSDTELLSWCEKILKHQEK